MDKIHRERIFSNMDQLINSTSYNRLIHTIDKLDEDRNVLTETLLSNWKGRPSLGWTNKQMCMRFYIDITQRGPDAFDLLMNSLKDSGHTDLACILDPTLSFIEEPIEVPLEFYNDDGNNYVFLNGDWESPYCNQDREALKSLFENQGYLSYDEKKVKLEDVNSLVVVVFSLYLNGSQQMENDWLHSHFNERSLTKKPKILISFLYTGLHHKGSVQEDTTKLVTRDYEDVLHIKIYVDASNRGLSSVVSEEVRHFISVFSSNDSMHLEEKLRTLQQKYNDHGLCPITTLDSRFRKLFRVRKQS